VRKLIHLCYLPSSEVAGAAFDSLYVVNRTASVRIDESTSFEALCVVVDVLDPLTVLSSVETEAPTGLSVLDTAAVPATSQSTSSTTVRPVNGDYNSRRTSDDRL
jgi:hypothetical protein